MRVASLPLSLLWSLHLHHVFCAAIYSFHVCGYGAILLRWFLLNVLCCCLRLWVIEPLGCSRVRCSVKVFIVAVTAVISVPLSVSVGCYINVMYCLLLLRLCRLCGWMRLLVRPCTASTSALVSAQLFGFYRPFGFHTFVLISALTISVTLRAFAAIFMLMSL